MDMALIYTGPDPVAMKSTKIVFTSRYSTLTFKHAFAPVIRICRICKFLGLPGPDPLVRGTDPDPVPPIIKKN
jgi:hypothetical protein